MNTHDTLSVSVQVHSNCKISAEESFLDELLSNPYSKSHTTYFNTSNLQYSLKEAYSKSHFLLQVKGNFWQTLTWKPLHCCLLPKSWDKTTGTIMFWSSFYLAHWKFCKDRSAFLLCQSGFPPPPIHHCCTKCFLISPLNSITFQADLIQSSSK